VAGDYVDKKY